MKDEDIFNEAQSRVKAKKGFFYHFLAYAFVLGLLYVIMQYENKGNIFPVILVAISWGIAIAIHYFKVFGTENLSALGINPHWEEDELEQEIEKLQRKRELKERLLKEKSLLDDLDNLELREIEKRSRDDEYNS